MTLKEKRKQRGKGEKPPHKKVKWDKRTIKAIASEVASKLREEEGQQEEPPTPTVRLRSPLGKQIQLPVVTPPCLSFLTP